MGTDSPYWNPQTLVAWAVRHSRGRDQRPVSGRQRLVHSVPHQLRRPLPPRVPDLRADRTPAMLMRERNNPLPRRDVITPIHAGAPGRDPADVGHADHLGHHEPSATEVSRAMTRADMDRVRDQFVQAASGALGAGFDLLELDMAHGHLLSSFLSPASNLRDDEYGGFLLGAREVPARGARRVSSGVAFRSAVECADLRHRLGRRGVRRKRRGSARPDAGGARVRHRRRVVRCPHAARAASIRPQLPDAVRRPDPQRGRLPTIAVGAISSYDDINTIICAGRADLCALARPHLYDPAWTLHAAADRNSTSTRGSRGTGPDRAGRRRDATACGPNSSAPSTRSRWSPRQSSRTEGR